METVLAEVGKLSILLVLILLISRNLPGPRKAGVFLVVLSVVYLAGIFFRQTITFLLGDHILGIINVIVPVLFVAVMIMHKDVVYPPIRRGATLSSKLLYHLFGPRVRPK